MIVSIITGAHVKLTQKSLVKKRKEMEIRTEWNQKYQNYPIKRTDTIKNETQKSAELLRWLSVPSQREPQNTAGMKINYLEKEMEANINLGTCLVLV